MVVNFKENGKTRKPLVNCLVACLGRPSVYSGVPKCEYRIGKYTVKKDGSLEFAEDTQDWKETLDFLRNAGFTPVDEIKQKTEPEAEVIEIETSEPKVETAPAQSEPKDKTLANLNLIINAKYGLILKALGREDLPVEVKDGIVSLHWSRENDDEDTVSAYNLFTDRLIKLAKESRWISAKEKACENEKYAFRCFLLRLGFIGDRYKSARKILLKNFGGSSAFRTVKPKQAV